MKKIQKKVVSTTLAAGMIMGMIPSTVFAAENYKAEFVMEVTSATEFPKPGDQVAVSLYMQNAGWAQKDKGTGWGAGVIQLTYDKTVLEYVDFAEEQMVLDAFNNIMENHVDNGATGEVLWMGMDGNLQNEISFTDEKTKVADIVFKVKDTLPENLDGVLEFVYPEQMDFEFGDFDKPDEQVPGIEDAVVTPVLSNHVKFDTTAPTIMLDGSSETKFYYSPVKAEVKDTNEISSVTLNDEALAAPYNITKSGKLVAKDKQGNTTTLEIVIDDAAYLEAKAAIEKLPENIAYKDEALVLAARKAVTAVADPTAKGKLDIARLEKAEESLKGLQQEKEALVQELANAKFAITLKDENVAAIQNMRTKVDALTEKGAAFTATELKNLTDAETAMKALQKRSQAAHAAIGKLPTADNTVWGDNQKLQELKKEIEDLKKLEDVFTSEEEAKLAEVEKGLQAIADLKVKVEQDIQTVLGKKISPELATQISSIQKDLDKLTAKGVESSTVKDYAKFTELAKKVQGMLDKIDAVIEQIEKLPSQDAITFKDEKAIAAAKAALDKLQAEGLNVPAETAGKLNAAEQTLETLKNQRAALVKEIADAKLNITLNQADKDAIAALRAKVDAMETKYAAFTEAELKNLTDAESKMDALEKRSKAAHASIDKLPTAEQTVWSDSQKLQDVKKEMEALEALGDVFTKEEEAKLTEVEKGLQAIAQLKEQIEAKIQTVLNKEVSPELAVEVNEIKEQLDKLNTKGIANGDVKDYSKFAEVASKVQDMLDKIDAVTNAINALPATEKISFGDEKAIEAAAAKLKALQAEKLDVTAEVKAKLAAAQKEIQELKAAREALVKEIANAKLTVDLNKENMKAIADLRAKVDGLNARGAAFTEEEMQNLTAAEMELSELKKRSQKVHDAIAALPNEEQVVWGNRENLESIQKELPELTQLGDTFTESEQKKLAAVEAALDRIEADAAQLKTEMESLPAQADQNSKNLLTEVETKIAALNNRGYAVDESTMGKAAMDRYNQFKEAVKKWESPTPEPTPAPTPAPTSEPTSAPTPAPQGAANGSPQTGDNTGLAGWLGLLGLSGLAAFITDRKRKKNL